MSLSTVDLLVGRLISLLENEAASLRGVPDEIKEMQRHLKSMRCFLMEADKGRANSEVHKDWVSNVREIAFEVEDAIDEFTYHVNKHRKWRGNSCRSFFRQSLHFPELLLERRKLAAELHNINKRMKRITKETHQLGVEQLEEIRFSTRYDLDWKNRLSESSLFLKDDDLVGFDKAQDELLGWLMDEERRRAAVTVVGMGGFGKTALVANTFRKQSVKQHFDFRVWITVSKQPVVEELLKLMVKEVYKHTNKEVPTTVDNMRYKELVETLVQYLQPRRYLIVLDDVWDTRFWQEINIVLPEGLRGSRVMVTTRNEDATPSPYGFVSHVHRIQPLRWEKAWELFCKRAFPDNLGQCPTYLESMAMNLAEKCKGMPLAIVALGGLMSSKKSIAEWKRVHDNLNWELSNNTALGSVKTILLLSYQDLPFQLKQCFLYCCLFPVDCMIYRKKLIRLWMAEGFLKEDNDAAPEAVGESYLRELICRSLLEVKERNASGRPKAFTMHDILRELALAISKEEKIVAVSDGGKGFKEDGIRRCSMTVKGEGIQPENGMSQLRSLFVFVVGDVPKSWFYKLPYGVKLLRVLDLENVPIIVLPTEVGNFFNLRYLNLTRTQVKMLPKSIGKLVNLRTLVLKEANIEELPRQIVKLENLRHLSGSVACFQDKFLVRYDCIRVPANVCKIKSLQVLSFVEGTGSLIKQLKEMTQLKTLGLSVVEEAYEKDLCSAIGEMKDLQNLLLYAPFERLRLDALLSAPPYLDKLFLNGEMDKVPRWLMQLKNLTQLTLQNSGLGEGLLSHIQELPNLSYLTLGDSAYNQERLCFVEGFQKLKFLRIFSLPSLNEIVVEKNVMSRLEKLQIEECKALRGLPYGLDHLTHLKEVSFYDVSCEIVKQLYEQGNIDTNSPAIQVIDMMKSNDDEAKSKWVYKILTADV